MFNLYADFFSVLALRVSTDGRISDLFINEFSKRQLRHARFLLILLLKLILVVIDLLSLLDNITVE